MDNEAAAVVMDFVPYTLKTMWPETALTRTEIQFREQRPDDFQHIQENADDFGVAIEWEAAGDTVGQYGYDTNYQLKGKVDKNVIEAESVEVDEEIALQFSDLWADNITQVISEAQERTTLSAREFATLITSNNPICNERRAADALGVTVGTYRGKKGRIAEKREECSETSVLDRVSKMHREGYMNRRREIGNTTERRENVAPSEIYDEQLSEDTAHYWSIVREDRREREHDTYEQPHWRTAHIEGIDNVFATPTKTGEDGGEIRIDIDGEGHPGADMHRPKENIQASMWLDEKRATMLYRQLQEALEPTSGIEETQLKNEEELLNWVDSEGISGDKIQIFNPEVFDIEPVSQAELEF